MWGISEQTSVVKSRYADVRPRYCCYTASSTIANNWRWYLTWPLLGHLCYIASGHVAWLFRRRSSDRPRSGGHIQCRGCVWVIGKHKPSAECMSCCANWRCDYLLYLCKIKKIKTICWSRCSSFQWFFCVVNVACWWVQREISGQRTILLL